jgi:hypothetical protein
LQLESTVHAEDVTWFQPGPDNIAIGVVVV